MEKKIYRRYRFRADCPLEVVMGGRKILAHANNVNQYGVCLDGQVDAKQGEELTLIVGSQPATGVVRWVSDQMVGVAFEKTISPRLVDYIRFNKSWSPTPDVSPPSKGWAF